MKESGIILNLRDKMITIDKILLPMRNINNLQGSSILQALRHNHSLAMEPQSTQNATEHATWILDAKYLKAESPVSCQRQSQAPKCQPTEESPAASQEI
jgi:hypothetical protein